ncbi:MAG: type II secretion system protein N [Granulosicoccus sp.]|nr:type II secretion system protein N [Granulosicoccus sp.]
MRIVGLCILGLVSYVLAVLVLFPASPIVDRIRPQLGPVALEGVHGRLIKGNIDRVLSTDDLLPLQVQNVGWTLSPAALFSGGAGASITFDGYGGTGRAKVQRKFNGDLLINDFIMNAQAKELEPLLPIPVASFAGEITADISQIKLVNQLLNRFDGTLQWRDAVLESPVPASLGNVTMEIKPDGEQTHVVTIAAAGGEVTADGTINVMLNGDFSADLLLTPSADASSAVIDGLSQMVRADDQGRFRIRQTGNFNRLM